MPYMDAAVLALSVIAQCLQMQRKIKNLTLLGSAWIPLSVGLFASRGLSLTAALYAAYWVNAWYGWWRWRKERTQLLPVPASPL